MARWDDLRSECYSLKPSQLFNRELKKSMLKGGDENPFNSSWFKQVDSRELRESILLDPSPCIVLATSGMMTGGPIIEYLKYWAPEPGKYTLLRGLSGIWNTRKEAPRGALSCSVDG